MTQHQITLHSPVDAVCISQQPQKKKKPKHPKQNILHKQKFPVPKIFKQHSFRTILLLKVSELFGLNTIVNIINRPAEIN